MSNIAPMADPGKIRSTIILLLTFLFLNPTHADEGMWLLPFLEDQNIRRMDSLGCELSANEIYSEDSLSLSDMVGSLDYGSCTAGLISGEGLILTNHHCAEDDVQSHSTPETDYLKNGFWAASFEEELPNPGKTISFLVRMEEVTERVLGMVHHEMTEPERNAEIEHVSNEIIQEATEDTHYEAFVEAFFEGNNYYLVVLETFRDVRLVAVPPEAIGRFGGDTDNWEWPRHNADFCLMRIYTGPDGLPADYSTDNIPYRTDRFLRVSTAGYQEDDFTMVLGFPGITSRYLTSARVDEIVTIENTNRIRIREAALEIMQADMKSSDRIRIQYTAKQSRLSNYYKYSIGQNRAARLLDISGKRRAQEEDFMKWAAMDSSRFLEYGHLIDEMSGIIKERKEMENALSYLGESFLIQTAVEIYDFAASAQPLYFKRLGFNAEDEEDILAEMEEEADEFFRDFNAGTDRKIAAALLRQYARNVEPIYFPGIYSTINKDFKSDLNRYLDDLYNKSIFTDSTRYRKFLRSPKHKKLIKDPAFQGSFALYTTYFQIMEEYEALEDRYITASRKYVRGLMEMYPDSVFYPDANSTLRISYGTVCGYRPRDAVNYDHFTTLDGVMEKHIPGSYEFAVPEKLRDLYRAKAYTPFTADSVMKVCFLTNLDTSGGNSGSPVLNSKGELIGLNFDGNWESLGGDIIYEPEFQRSICVDIRYILFLLDEFGESPHLVEEMILHD